MELRRKYGIDIVTRAQHEGLEVVDDIETALKEATFEETTEEHSRLGATRVWAAAVEDVPPYDDKRKPLGQVNAVVADENGKRLIGEDGKERPRLYYVTTPPLTNRAYRTRALYHQRQVTKEPGASGAGAGLVNQHPGGAAACCQPCADCACTDAVQRGAGNADEGQSGRGQRAGAGQANSRSRLTGRADGGSVHAGRASRVTQGKTIRQDPAAGRAELDNNVGTVLPRARARLEGPAG